MTELWRWLVLALALTVANFLYQFLTKEDYRKAFERSWFQCTALLFAYLMFT